jgi:hypothetical protein
VRKTIVLKAINSLPVYPPTSLDNIETFLFTKKITEQDKKLFSDTDYLVPNLYNLLFCYATSAFSH